jgi:hypothetical protein
VKLKLASCARPGNRAGFFMLAVFMSEATATLEMIHNLW